MVKVERIAVETAEEMIKNAPTRQPGRWNKVFETVKKTGDAVKVEDVSRGTAWHLKRRAKEQGLVARVIGGTTVVIMPAKKKK